MNKRSFKYACVLDKQKADRMNATTPKYSNARYDEIVKEVYSYLKKDVYKIGGIGIVPVGCVETGVVKPVNLAVSLEKMCRVKARLLDVDIYVPSITLIMYLQGKLELSNNRKMIPIESCKVKCISIGSLADERETIVWKGPIVFELKAK
ncbi:putative transcription factor bHLH3-like [Capsicum annuum]|nr:putative transcription factor bHLH3-like [Capsicum annuum]